MTAAVTACIVTDFINTRDPHSRLPLETRWDKRVILCVFSKGVHGVRSSKALTASRLFLAPPRNC